MIIYPLSQGQVINTGVQDLPFHYRLANKIHHSIEPYVLPKYPSLFHILSLSYVVLFGGIIVYILLPMILGWFGEYLGENPYHVVLCYFLFDVALCFFPTGTFPQALATCFFLVFLYYRNECNYWGVFVTSFLIIITHTGTMYFMIIFLLTPDPWIRKLYNKFFVLIPSQSGLKNFRWPELQQLFFIWLGWHELNKKHYKVLFSFICLVLSVTYFYNIRSLWLILMFLSIPASSFFDPDSEKSLLVLLVLYKILEQPLHFMIDVPLYVF